MTSLTQKISPWTRTAAFLLSLAGCEGLPERSFVEDGREQQKNSEEQQENSEEKRIDAFVSANEPREDVHSETSRENALSQNSYPYQVLGKPVFFEPRLEKDEERKIAGNLGENATKAQNSLEHFSSIYERLAKIIVERNSDPFMHFGAACDWTKGTIRFYKFPTHSGLWVHELTHFWHHTLTEKNGFDLAWESITGQGYMEICGTSAGGIGCVRSAMSVAAVSMYGTRNQVEDVAEVGTLVHNLLHPAFSYTGFPNKPSHVKTIDDPLATGHDYHDNDHTITRANIPRIKRKVALLREYGFLSEREHRYVQAELAGFREEVIRERRKKWTNWREVYP